jgi:hypothetical protein
MRTPYNGSVPVAGLPGFLRLTDIDLAIIPYNVKLHRREVTLPGFAHHPGAIRRVLTLATLLTHTFNGALKVWEIDHWRFYDSQIDNEFHLDLSSDQHAANGSLAFQMLRLWRSRLPHFCRNEPQCLCLNFHLQFPRAA